ncbi:pabpc1-b [Symbiodinium sp. CCMP2592]|nr:pabpc1-b [Symbiodinium sp. CCMP2592]
MWVEQALKGVQIQGDDPYKVFTAANDAPGDVTDSRLISLDRQFRRADFPAKFSMSTVEPRRTVAFTGAPTDLLTLLLQLSCCSSVMASPSDCKANSFGGRIWHKGAGSGLTWTHESFAGLCKLACRMPELPHSVHALKDVRLVRDFLKRSKGYAYIDFDSSAHVGEAVEKFNGQQVNKRVMRVARSLPTKRLYEEKVLFVKNIGAAASEDDIKSAFSAQGEVASVRIPRDNSQEGKAHKGYAYVEFASDETVKAALACEKPMEIGGQVVVLSRSIPMKDHRHTTAATRKDLPQRVNQRNIVQGRIEREDPVKQSSKCPTTVHVNNLAFSVDEAQLTEHFQQCGPVSQVVVVRNDMGRSRGFGFVEFQEESDAQTALMFSDSLLGGREIVVSKSTRAISQKKKSKDEIEKGANKGLSKGKEKPQDKGKSKGEEKKSKGKGGKDSSRRRINLETVEKEESATSAADEVPALVRPEVLDEVPAPVHPEVLDEVPELMRPDVLDEVPALTRPDVLDEVPAPVCPAVLGEVPAAVRPENLEEPAAKRPKEEAAPTNLSNADFRKFLPC